MELISTTAVALPALMTGAVVTVNAFAKVEICPSGLVTLTDRVPVAAEIEMLMFALNKLEELNEQELTVIPAPKLQVAPLRKFDPFRFTVNVDPWLPEVGLIDVKLGGGGGGACVMLKPLFNVPVCRSGLVTLTARAPTVAPAEIEMFAVTCVAELTVHEFTVTPEPKLHVAPVWKLFPVTATFSVTPWFADVGATELTVGAASGAGCTISTHARSVVMIEP